MKVYRIHGITAKEFRKAHSQKFHAELLKSWFKTFKRHVSSPDVSGMEALAQIAATFAEAEFQIQKNGFGYSMGAVQPINYRPNPGISTFFSEENGYVRHADQYPATSGGLSAALCDSAGTGCGIKISWGEYLPDELAKTIVILQPTNITGILNQ